MLRLCWCLDARHPRHLASKIPVLREHDSVCLNGMGDTVFVLGVE